MSFVPTIFETGSGFHPSYSSMGIGFLFSGVKRPGRNVDHTPLSGAEIKNEWSCTSTPALCLPGLDSDNFIVSLLNL